MDVCLDCLEQSWYDVVAKTTIISFAMVASRYGEVGKYMLSCVDSNYLRVEWAEGADQEAFRSVSRFLNMLCLLCYVYCCVCSCCFCSMLGLSVAPVGVLVSSVGTQTLKLGNDHPSAWCIGD